MDWNGLGLAAALYSRDKDLAALVKHMTGRRISNVSCSKNRLIAALEVRLLYIRVPVLNFTFEYTNEFETHYSGYSRPTVKAPSRKVSAIRFAKREKMAHLRELPII
jgi:hypothetical protein